MNEQSNDSCCGSEIGVSGLLNADKISLVAVVLDNLELFYRHYKNITSFVVDPTEPSIGKENPKPKVCLILVFQSVIKTKKKIKKTRNTWSSSDFNLLSLKQ